jgi:hypothetical protein
MAKYDDLVNKHVMLKKDLVTLKKTSKGSRCANKIPKLLWKKKGDYNKMTLEAKKEKNKLANLSIEEEKSLRV